MQSLSDSQLPTERIRGISRAAEILSQGGIVAFPTETVFGLGADATNSAAVARLFEAKGRPSDNPLIVHLAQASDWNLAADEMTPVAERLLSEFAPGPISVVLPKGEEILPQVTAGLDTVAIRIPACSIAQQILQECDVPIAAPSANLSGRPSATRWQAVWEDLEGRVDGVVCLDSARIGIESTVVDCCGPVPVVLRSGGITLEAIRELFPAARALEAPRKDSQGSEMPVRSLNSPGLRHRHYCPDAPVTVFTGNSIDEAMVDHERLACCALGPLHATGEQFLFLCEFQDLPQYAREFYEFLREADRRGADKIAVQLAPDHGIGRALRDRQLRAAGDVQPPEQT